MSEDLLNFATVKAELEFANIAVQMLGRNLVEAPYQAAL